LSGRLLFRVGRPDACLVCSENERESGVRPTGAGQAPKGPYRAALRGRARGYSAASRGAATPLGAPGTARPSGANGQWHARDAASTGLRWFPSVPKRSASESHSLGTRLVPGEESLRAVCPSVPRLCPRHAVPSVPNTPKGLGHAGTRGWAGFLGERKFPTREILRSIADGLSALRRIRP
jgi:hypothetical protein